jgi:hypothetical protein
MPNNKNDVEILKSIIIAKRDLEIANKNFENAENELIDYYSYQIKANKAKLDYLLKIVKQQNIKLDLINGIELEKSEAI